MNRSPSCLRKLNYSFLTVCCWMNVQGLALAAAARGAAEKEASGPSWVLPYAFVILCVGLGMFVVCRSARRKERARPEDYEKTSLLERGDAGKGVIQEKRRGLQRSKQECKDAKTALTMSIIGVFIVPMCVVGLIQGIKARKLISQDRRLSGDEKALGAIIVALAGLGIWLLIGVFGLVIMLSGPADSGPSRPVMPPAAEAEEDPGSSSPAAAPAAEAEEDSGSSSPAAPPAAEAEAEPTP